ncbi:hypothetical protein [Zhongshania aliphaticivorans]|uniref:hypothetical protein n=1 Tax=Zhongshania aliphaticivorans TaxID=1470434 RepID=UPI0013307B96|nr:hypothetical protein [Zhongshania aliphaticivorans]
MSVANALGSSEVRCGADSEVGGSPIKLGMTGRVVGDGGKVVEMAGWMVAGVCLSVVIPDSDRVSR